MRAIITVKCVLCNRVRQVGPGEIPKDEVPLCSRCGMPMTPIRAKAKEK